MVTAEAIFLSMMSILSTWCNVPGMDASKVRQCRSTVYACFAEAKQVPEGTEGRELLQMKDKAVDLGLVKLCIFDAAFGGPPGGNPKKKVPPYDDGEK